MPLSGSINIDFTATQFIQFALRKINALALGQSPSSESADAALMELEMLLKEWQKYPGVWRKKEGFVTLVDATASYSLTPRPYRIFSVRYRNTSSQDRPPLDI